MTPVTTRRPASPSPGSTSAVQPPLPPVVVPDDDDVRAARAHADERRRRRRPPDAPRCARMAGRCPARASMSTAPPKPAGAAPWRRRARIAPPRCRCWRSRRRGPVSRCLPRPAQAGLHPGLIRAQSGRSSTAMSPTGGNEAARRMSMLVVVRRAGCRRRARPSVPENRSEMSPVMLPPGTQTLSAHVLPAVRRDEDRRAAGSGGIRCERRHRDLARVGRVGADARFAVLARLVAEGGRDNVDDPDRHGSALPLAHREQQPRSARADRARGSRAGSKRGEPVRDTRAP